MFCPVECGSIFLTRILPVNQCKKSKQSNKMYCIQQELKSWIFDWTKPNCLWVIRRVPGFNPGFWWGPYCSSFYLAFCDVFPLFNVLIVLFVFVRCIALPVSMDCQSLIIHMHMLYYAFDAGFKSIYTMYLSNIKTVYCLIELMISDIIWELD